MRRWLNANRDTKWYTYCSKVRESHRRKIRSYYRLAMLGCLLVIIGYDMYNQVVNVTGIIEVVDPNSLIYYDGIFSGF